MVAVAETGVVVVVHVRSCCCCRYLTNVSCLKTLPDNYRPYNILIQQDDNIIRSNVQCSHCLPLNNPFQDSDDLIPAQMYLLGTITELSR
jgi:hypothetical protein